MIDLENIKHVVNGEYIVIPIETGYIKPNEEGEGMEYEAIGKDPEMSGYEKDKWFFVNFTNDK